MPNAGFLRRYDSKILREGFLKKNQKSVQGDVSNKSDPTQQKNSYTWMSQEVSRWLVNGFITYLQKWDILGYNPLTKLLLTSCDIQANDVMSMIF